MIHALSIVSGLEGFSYVVNSDLGWLLGFNDDWPKSANYVA